VQALPARRRAELLRRAGGVAALALAGWLLLNGRVWFALPLAFFAYFALLRSPGGDARQQAENARLANVRTALLEMSLDQATGALSGHVLAGTFSGRDLGTLTRAELGVLWRECRAGEAQSRQLLEAYLDRRWPEWRSEMPRASSGSSQDGRQTGDVAAVRTPMTRQEAFDVLGLSASAGLEDIKTAHRNLMKRLHPDQGGSNYLAAKINEAKEVLTGKRG
jgi:DnaJ domain